MSEYLNRLIRRTQAARESQFLQPFVRSTSPIAEQDQRLGVAGFEEVDQQVPSSTHGGRDWEGGEAVEAQAATTPDITTSSDVTVQRKMVSPATSSSPSSPDASTPSLPIASDSAPTNVPDTGDRPSLGSRGNRSRPLEFSELPQTESLSSSRSESGELVQGDSTQGATASSSLSITGELGSPPQIRGQGRLLHSSETLAGIDTSPPTEVEKSKGVEADAYPSVAAPVGTPMALPGLGRRIPWDETKPSVGLDHVNRDDIRYRTGLQEPTAQIQSLEPLMGSLGDRDDPLFEEAPILTFDQPESPRVVIGRINVEVVPQSVPEATVAPSRSQPLTAASVSVIGPLGGGISSNLRLSLRQR